MMAFYTEYAVLFAVLWCFALAFCVWRAVTTPIHNLTAMHRLGLVAPMVYCAMRLVCTSLRAAGNIGRADDVAAILCILSLPLAVATVLAITDSHSRTSQPCVRRISFDADRYHDRIVRQSH